MINSTIILDFWFKECNPKMWFKKDQEFDESEGRYLERAAIN